jgi:hypothetical protein
VCAAYTFLNKYAFEKKRSKLYFSKCPDLTEDEESDEDDSEITSFGGRYDDNDDDTPLAVPLE